MSDRCEKDCDALLRELELKRGVIDKFGALGTSSWVMLKNLLFGRSLNHLGFSQIDRTSFVSRKALGIIALSLWHYALACVSLRRRDLFVGAGSGVFSYQGRIVDSFVPAELSRAPGEPAPELLYLLSANHLDVLSAQRPFLREHGAVVYSVLVSPVKLAVAKVLGIFLARNRRLRTAAEEVSAAMASISVEVNVREILEWHARFVAGVILFRILFLPLRIRRAFVVSAYSNSEICAVLKKMKISVTEVQHGIVGPIHRGYNYARKSECLPTPDFVSVYSEFWKHQLARAGFFGPAQIRVEKRLKYVLAEAEQRAVDYPFVVFSGQGILANEVAAFLRQLVTAQTGWHAIYVPHPAERPEFSEPIAAAARECPRIHIWPRGGATTERLIIDSLAHVSFYSSCHFDSVHYKNKTFILDLVEEKLMHYYAESMPEQFVRILDAAGLVAHFCDDMVEND